jgi:hypothetical protein
MSFTNGYMARKTRNSTGTYRYLLTNLNVERQCGFTTDESVYLRHYETAEDDEQDAEEDGDDDFDWVQYTKECRERRAAKEAQSSEQEKS